MIHYPDWLQRLQQEIDGVCGSERLPSPLDMPQMPTLRAVMRETLRWRPVAPYGAPHVLSEDDMYNSVPLKKGTILHALECEHVTYEDEKYRS